jgi:cobalt/nickel transport system ATP-binding protein
VTPPDRGPRRQPGGAARREPGAATPPVGLGVRDLAYHYPGGEPVLHDVTFDVAPGERVALLGANGAGKSTLLLHLNGLLRPDRGTVTIDGIAVEDGSLRDVRRRVGLVFQDPDDQLFLPTLLEDVAFGPLNEGADPMDAEDAARAQLAELGLAAAADRAAHHLSGGEKRLASLATVLVSTPALLALDEPTAGLDARARSRVVHLLAGRPETLLLATHDLDVARSLCPLGLVLDRGRVAAFGPLSRIVDDPDLLTAHGLTAPLPPTAAPGRNG